MKHARSRRDDRATAGSRRYSVSPYSIEEVWLTPGELLRHRGGMITVVANHQSPLGNG